MTILLVSVFLAELKERIKELEEKESTMLEERKKLEEDYGHRRAKLKELYLQKESEWWSDGGRCRVREGRLTCCGEWGRRKDYVERSKGPQDCTRILENYKPDD